MGIDGAAFGGAVVRVESHFLAIDAQNPIVYPAVRPAPTPETYLTSSTPAAQATT
jgi:hypothetical protein